MANTTDGKIDLLNNQLVINLIKLSLLEDCVDHDVTSKACLAKELRANAEIRAKQELVVCGLPILELISELANAQVDFSMLANEGEIVPASTVLCRLSGSARDLMRLERTFLNFLQRLSGVATHTRNISANSKIKVLDTRKTIPGWRTLDKYAVRIGGAFNHRHNLADLILVKDTHVNACAGMNKALTQIFINKASEIAVEVEVRDILEVKEALNFPIQIIMLDNFSDHAIKEAVSYIRKVSTNITIEVSGGITKERIAQLSDLGVDCVSVGALTTQARNTDISMYVTLREKHE